VGRAPELPGTRPRGLGDRSAPRQGAGGAAAPVREAFPKIDNAPSNAICHKLGFTLLEEIDFPARQGGFMRCNDWRFDL